MLVRLIYYLNSIYCLCKSKKICPTVIEEEQHIIFQLYAPLHFKLFNHLINI